MRVSELTSSKGIWNGWYWRYVGLTVLVVAILQVVSHYTIRWPMMQSTQLAMFIAMWFIVPRVQERRLANTLVGVILTFVIGVVLQLTLDQQFTLSHGVSYFLEQNLIMLLVGVLLAYAYLKLSMWSERKRKEREARYRQTQASAKPERPPECTARKSDGS